MSKKVLFPELHNTNNSGKDQRWAISVQKRENGTAIITEHGLVDGKITIAETFITKGKNIGKANETDDYTQAISEAKYKWNLKKRKGYYENKKDKLEKGNIYLPMLAHNYSKRCKDIEFPAFCQSKLDGVRAVYNPNYKKLQSRTGIIFQGLNHIVDELNIVGDSTIILDGELYSDSLTFQEIAGIVSKEKITDNDLKISKKIKFIVYDIILDKDYIDRLNFLKYFFDNNKLKHTILLKTDICNNSEDIKKFHDKYIKEGYEGIIIRNYKGKYANIRSKNLQKYKEFDDEEFKIVGYTEGTGIEEGLVIWECETKECKRFRVRPKGTHLERKKLFKNGSSYIGKMLTVRLFGYTNDGLPRFPVGINVRDYE